MQNNNDVEEVASARVNIGIRISPELKEELNYEALELGQSSSEYGELILNNRHQARNEIVQLKQTLEQKDKTIAEFRLQLTDKQKLEMELASSRKEVLELKEVAAKLNAQNGLFNDKRLNYLFEHLKGKKDKVENAYSGGDFDITYNTPVDVLIALIYSSTLNQ